MTHTIDPDPHYVENESVQWNFTVEEGGSARDIEGATLEWYLLPVKSAGNDDAQLDHDSSGVSISFTGNGSDGRVDLVIDQDTTTGISAGWHRVIVDDSGTGKQIWGGPFPVDEV